MPLREFVCPEGHVTEKYLSGSDDILRYKIECQGHVSPQVLCGHVATRVETSRTGAPQLYGEGFYKPTHKEQRRPGS